VLRARALRNVRSGSTAQHSPAGKEARVGVMWWPRGQVQHRKTLLGGPELSEQR